MELFVTDARSAKLVDDVKLPATAAKAIRAHTTLRKRADQGDRRAALHNDLRGCPADLVDLLAAA
jgi:hypothetical protein